MEETYTPKPPRLCPACGSAVADGFDACPVCGQLMPSPQAAPSVAQSAGPDPRMTAPYMYGIPEGSTIVQDRKDYFEHYLPRQQYHGIVTMTLIAQFITLLLGLYILTGGANNNPVMFIAHSVIMSVLAFWVLQRMDVTSGVIYTVYTCIFFFVSLAVFDLAFFYPAIATVVSLITLVKSQQSWKAYQRAPIPMTILSDDEKKRTEKTKRGYRITLIVLAVILIVMGGVFFWLKSEEDRQYADYTVGEVNGDTYVNDFAHITFTLPDGWDYLTEDELKDMNDEFFGYEYDPEGCAALVSADNGNEDNFEYITVYVTRHERVELAEDYIKSVRDEIKFAYGGLDGVKVDCEFLDDVTLNGVTYEVLHTVYTYTDGVNSITYDEYILVQRIGAMTFEIYIQPNEDHSYAEILACFQP